MINKRVVFILFFCLLFCAGSATVWGSGFHIHEQGAKAMGMGNAFVGLADDPSALFYNPAGIAFQKGTQIDLGATAISVPNTKFRGNTKLGNNQASPALGVPLEDVEARAKRDVFLPPNLYVVHSFEDVPISVGLGINSIYSLSKRWKSESVFQDEIRDISIKSLNFQPTVAYRLDKYNLAFAVGIDYTYAMLRLEKAVHLLEQTDLPVETIAGQCGFSYAYYFARVFCQRYGLTPAKYRAEHAEKMQSPE